MAKERIVVIEDNKDMRENLSEILELSGYEVKTAPNGKAGLELIHQFTPDLIICDIMMPELDGYGVIHILQQNSNTANIPFIFLTAKVEKSDFRKGMNLGADDYLTKPFEDIDLLNAEVKRRMPRNANIMSSKKRSFCSSKESYPKTFIWCATEK
jgi:CheY-like chemotaxis protein